MSGGAAAGAPARYRVEPGGRITGTLGVPGDKSISHRALMLGAIAEGDTHISGFLAGEDCLSTARALQALGVRIERPQETQVLVHGVGAAGLTGSAAALDMGNAGTAMRLFTGLLAPQSFNSTLIGDASLMRRPMQRVAVPLAHDGRADPHTRRTPAGRDQGHAAPARDSLQPAGRERAGEVRGTAGRARGRGPHPRHRAGAVARSHRAHAAPPSARGSSARAAASRSKAARP